MATADQSAEPTHDVVARIAYWGPPGAGTSTSLESIHARLKPSKRGDLVRLPTRLDPTVTYEELPIQLGPVGGQRTELRLVGIPAAPGHAATRMQLLDQVDGVVLVLDGRGECLAQNAAAVSELRESLSAYGVKLEALPLVLQINRSDLSDPESIANLTRELGLSDAARFETIASEGQGVLEALTTISKQVVRVLRHRSLAPEPVAATTTTAAFGATTTPLPRSPEHAAPLASVDGPSANEVMEAAILAEGPSEAPEDRTIHEARMAFDQSWSEVEAAAKRDTGMRLGSDLRIVSVGQAERTAERAISVPLILGNAEGETLTLSLGLSLEPLLASEPGDPDE